MRLGASRTLFIAVALLLPRGLLAGPSIDLDTNQVAFLNYKADHILAEMQKTSDDLHLRFVGPTHFVPTWGTINSDDGGIMITGSTIRLDSAGHSFRFRNSDCRFDGYQNSLYDVLPENQILNETPDKPKWSEEQAIEVGTAFKNIFVEPTDALLGQPHAEYTHTSFAISKSNTLRSRKGMWMIVWPRVDSQGHFFYGDHVTIQIQEGYAPLGVGVYLTTPYKDEKTELVSEADALTKAMRLIFLLQLGEKIFYHCVSVDDYERNIVGDEVLSKELMVVLPKRSFLGHIRSVSESTTARLAWVIWFRPIHSSKPPAIGWYDEDFAIWIDAHTGQIIGYNAML
jgi:hypothetical protein